MAESEETRESPGASAGDDEEVGGLQRSLLEGERLEELEKRLEDHEMEERLRQRRGGREETNW